MPPPSPTYSSTKPISKATALRWNCSHRVWWTLLSADLALLLCHDWTLLVTLFLSNSHSLFSSFTLLTSPSLYTYPVLFGLSLDPVPLSAHYIFICVLQNFLFLSLHWAISSTYVILILACMHNLRHSVDISLVREWLLHLISSPETLDSKLVSCWEERYVSELSVSPPLTLFPIQTPLIGVWDFNIHLYLFYAERAHEMFWIRDRSPWITLQ